MSRYWKRKIESPVGELTVLFSERGVAYVLWEKEKLGRMKTPEKFETSNAPAFVEETLRQLGEYFRRERKTFDVPLDPQGTPFQLKAWSALREIPYGRTFSYQEQARRIGDARKARAVGAANGKNPISIIVPCHRVIGKNGSLTGFGGGIDVKEKLLRLESE